MIKLDIGTSSKRKGWITYGKPNLADGQSLKDAPPLIYYTINSEKVVEGRVPDVIGDVTQGLPFKSNSVDLIYSSHFLEHFESNEIMRLLLMFKDILKPGGMLKICVPNARIFIDFYLNPEKVRLDLLWIDALQYKTPIDYVNYMAYMKGWHKHLFDMDNLLAFINEAGFKEVKPSQFNPDIDLFYRRSESIYAEAIK